MTLVLGSQRLDVEDSPRIDVEDSVSISNGFTLRPESEFSLSVDFYQIKLKERINRHFY